MSFLYHRNGQQAIVSVEENSIQFRHCREGTVECIKGIKSFKRGQPLTLPIFITKVLLNYSQALFKSNYDSIAQTARALDTRQYKNNIGLLQDEDGHLPNRDRDKAELFNTLFASVFNTDDGPREFQCRELEDQGCGNDQLMVNPETGWDLLLQLNLNKTMGPDGIHPRILKEVADVTAKPLSMISERSWESAEVSAYWKLVKVFPVFKKSQKVKHGNYSPVSLTLVLS
ncbi:hypothetical protein HGM15179_003912 [Zosterops borbonicus]|uniref:Uncharacterized protein n=1 Tax=Zosterops borbonicus TaxID=364589 RepID=A0A8K1GQ72_9PASS|nr:hypothetical protein HGM15179_003912 [Zosterops borbonicus]